MSKFEFVVGGSSVPVRRPINVTWNQPPTGDLANGLSRRAVKAQVTWEFPRLTEKELLVLTARYSPTGVPITFRTFVPASGGTGAQWILCTGVMQPVEQGNERGGFYTGVRVIFNRVQVV